MNTDNNQNDKKLVSAIITTHERKPETVLRAVNSVLNQTYSNMEIIVVDDSSPSFRRRFDVKQSVCGASDKIIYIVNEFSLGACASRNKGLSSASGYYVAFLDDDDEWLPNKIEEQLKGFLDDSIALVYNPIIVVDEENCCERIINTESESGYIFRKLLKSNIIGSTSNPLIKKSCLETIGNFDLQFESCQDYDLWLRLALRFPVQYIELPLLRYHNHSDIRISLDSEKLISGHKRLNLKYADYINNDNDTWYIRHSFLIPHYLKKYGRKKAFSLWISCVKKRPVKLFRNIDLLNYIVFGFNSYKVLRKPLARLYRGIRDKYRTIGKFRHTREISCR